MRFEKVLSRKIHTFLKFLEMQVITKYPIYDIVKIFIYFYNHQFKPLNRYEESIYHLNLFSG